MGTITMLRCISCGTDFAQHEIENHCPTCGPRRGTLDVLYDYETLKRTIGRDSFGGLEDEHSMWRYLPLLPIENRRFIQPLRVGWTPVYPYPDLAAQFDLADLYIKDDGQNPTASCKDRASALVVIKAQEQGRRIVACASTGNTASSLAGFAAATNIDPVIFVPKAAPEAKVMQLLVYGARVFIVNGSYDAAYDLATEAVETFGWYNRSDGSNPYIIEGKKTMAFELAEQLDWNLPDIVLIGVGDGSVISSICKGFDELRTLELISRVPRVIGVQAVGSAPIAAAFADYAGGEVSFEDIEAHTLADSICVGKPRDIVKAVKYVAQNNGEFITVTDEEIVAAILAMARNTGVFPEPAGAAPFAGLSKLVKAGRLSGMRVAVMVTGNGLKDVAAARTAVAAPMEIEPSLDAVKRHLERLSIA